MSVSTRLMQALAGGVSILAIATPAQAQVQSFNIPAGNLKGALDAFARQSGMQVIYRDDDVRTASSHAVSGMTAAPPEPGPGPPGATDTPACDRPEGNLGSGAAMTGTPSR